MKIIDLLNKIANGEAPEKIRFARKYWYRRNGLKNVYYFTENEDEDLYVYLFRHSLSSTLNDEVEIQKEEKKIPETINNWTSAVGRVDDSNIEEYIHKLFEQQTILYFKINSIIDYLKSKGE